MAGSHGGDGEKPELKQQCVLDSSSFGSSFRNGFDEDFYKAVDQLEQDFMHMGKALFTFQLLYDIYDYINNKGTAARVQF